MCLRLILLLFIVLRLPEGKSTITSQRIIGGQVPAQNQFPHSVRLAVVTNENYEYTCGGSLIHSFWVLTTAFCVIDKRHIDLLLGASVLGEGLTMRSKTFFHHPQFKDDNFDFDIGLVKLYTQPCAPFISPVRLLSKWQAKKTWDSQVVQIPGWGYEKDATHVSDKQRWITMRVISNRKCSLHFEPEFISKYTMCAVGKDNYTHSTCHGDSGNGLLIEDQDGIYTQIAVASFVSSASCYESPAGFVRLGNFLDWIHDSTGLEIRDK